MPPTPDSATAFSRRRFVALATALPTLALAPSLVRGAATPAIPNGQSKRKVPIGIELYAVREELKRDLPHTLRQVAAMGYEAVEFYSPYYQWTFPYAKEVRTMIDDLGLRCLSTHNHIESFTPGVGIAKAIELNQILGARQIVLASAPRSTRGLEGWKALSGQLSAAVTQLLPHGLTAGFHNHQAEWAMLDGGKRIMDVLAENTPPEFVLQLDVGTCLEAGADPVAWIRAHPGRTKSIHLKEWAPGSEAEEKGYRVLFGEGVAPWADIIAAAESVGGVEVYLMEQEGSRFSEFETAARCLASWKKLRERI